MTFTTGMIPHAPQTHIAIPTAFPGSVSLIGIFLNLNSFAKDLANAETTKKFQIMLNSGISKSQTSPGCIVRDEGAHLSSV